MNQRTKERPADKAFQVSTRFTKASSFKNDLSDSKTLANKVIQPNSTGYDVSAKCTVIKLSARLINSASPNATIA